MKLLGVKTLQIQAVKIIRYARFCDHRGYFTESFRRSDLKNNKATEFMKDVEFVQCNESYSKKSTVRGLHFQWNPYMGKMVRTLRGRMIDMVLDIRKGSPTFGKILLYDMPTDHEADYNEWIWVPPGFAHGFFFTEDSTIEYLCSGEYSSNCEACISPLAKDIDWELCEPELKQLFDSIVPSTTLITDKDKDGYTVADWESRTESGNFLYGQL
ncbi:MAG: dTDP-4-dehydrorhamnose 3,5-epimerase family protein [Sedimentisphaerales bacterium]|nr:dTDP-4-dehydrorhamnose 3,5-epimerase family protein [Sedimentisphaerales bacterium]